MRWAFWRRPRGDRELEEELRFHLEMQTRQNLAAGMDPEEARYAALRTFGGVAQVQEDCRDQRRRRWLADLQQDLRYGVRTLGKSPGFTAVAVLSLALGIGATAAIFSVVQAVLLRSLPYREPDRLVMVYDRWPNGLRGAVSPANFVDWRDQNQVFSGMAAFTGTRQDLTLTGWEDARRVRAQNVSADFFSILGVPAAQGRTFRPEEDSPASHQVVVLSHSLRTRLFAPGDNPIGRTLELDGESHTVIGVLPPSFRFVESQFRPVEIELWRPNPFRQDPPTQRTIHRLLAIARLKPGVTTQQAQVEMDRIAGGLGQAYPDTNKNWGVTVWPLADDLVFQVRPALLILAGAVVFVLLIACANVASLLLARAAARQREVAVRSALGAGRMRLVRQFLTEAVLVSLVGAALGVLLARWAVPSLVALSPASLPRAAEIAVDERVLGFTLLVAVLTGLLFGLAPAVLGSRPNLNESLKEARRVAAPVFPRWRLDSVFVVVQVALCLVLLAGAGLLLNSFLRYRAVALGFDPENVITIRVSLPRTKYAQRAGIATQAHAKGFQIWAVRPEQTAFVEQVLDRAHRLPGVVSAAATNFLPMAGRSWGQGFSIEGRPKAPNQGYTGALLRPVTPDFFRAAGLPLLKGRAFTAQDRAGSLDVVIVSEVLARKHWPDADPLGKRLLLHDGTLDRERPFEIVGVAGNTRQDLLLAEQGQEDGVLYFPYRQQAPAYVDYQIGSHMSVAFLVRTSADPGPLAKALRETIREVDKDQPIESITTLGEFVAGGETERRFYLLLLATFAGVALVLAAVGVFGVVHYSVAQRTHEIGVRIALGAGRGDVLRLVLQRGVALTLAGVVLGLGGALGLGRYLTNQLYRVTPQDPSTLAAVSLLLVAVAVAASWLPAHRATRVDPMEALRHE